MPLHPWITCDCYQRFCGLEDINPGGRKVSPVHKKLSGVLDRHYGMAYSNQDIEKPYRGILTHFRRNK